MKKHKASHCTGICCRSQRRHAGRLRRRRLLQPGILCCHNSTPASGDVTIKLATWDNTSKNMVTDAVAAFETANPGIKVEIIDIPSADYTTKLSVMLNGGSDVDAFFIKDGDTAKSLVEKGQLADLSAYIAADGVNLADYNGLAENFTFDGKQYALPARTDFYVMYYNKDIFDAANIAYPTNDWTWADFEETAKMLTAARVPTRSTALTSTPGRPALKTGACRMPSTPSWTMRAATTSSSPTTRWLCVCRTRAPCRITAP